MIMPALVNIFLKLLLVLPFRNVPPSKPVCASSVYTGNTLVLQMSDRVKLLVIVRLVQVNPFVIVMLN